MRKLFLLFLAFSLFFVACNDGKSGYLPGYSGNSGEIIFVINDDDFKASEETIYQTIAGYQHGMPQAERLFSIVNIPHKNFSKIFQVNRNIIIADIGQNKVKNVEIKRSVWAKKQMVVTITAGSVETFNQLLVEYAEELIFKFQSAEIERLIERNQKFGFEKELKEHQMKFVFQQDAGDIVDNNDFIWIKLERERPVGENMHQISQGVLIFTTPYTDTSQFNLENILALKDSLTKLHVPGPINGSYMSTSYKHILPDAKEFLFKGKYAVRITGLWRMENAHMGGPFVSITTLDEKNNNLVTLVGYVYAPQFEKREFLREMEAIIHSIEFTSNQQ